MVKKGAWVTIENVVLLASERGENLPADTRRTDLKKWVRGTLARRAQIGGPAIIVTPSGRKESGVLVEVNPSFAVGYGTYVPELRKAADQAREFMRGQLVENSDGSDDL
ncbi:MAG: 2-amino-4-oxopentanoate thiolase subunit OrtA [Defluviitaleaceae bacterium]|nr:2-amino-4-oxopentanoate thiolase subunit OrtA [Defluviitaleaceae bacterium]MCL2836988.1 2-amino-4-oxopentanoate thiolase subunit OrtA [Defluviitaleaceae bacterium]